MSSGPNIFLGTIINNISAPVMTSNDEFSIKVTVTTSAAGELRIGSVFSNSQGQINGFTLEPVVPEPSSGLLALAAGAFAPRRRRA